MSRPLTREVAREAWRNLLTDTSHVGIWGLILAAVLSLLGWADTYEVTSLSEQSAAYVAGGGATWMLQAPSQIDGTSCERLRLATGVRAAGGLRDTGSYLTTTALPGAPLPLYEVTSGFAQVLGSSAAGGILIPDDVASALNISSGESLATNLGAAPIGEVYAYPDDGRRPIFSYAALAMVPDTGQFDECWVTVWPTDQATINLLYTALKNPTGQFQGSPQLAQLNPNFASQFDAATLFGTRFTRFAGWACLLFGLVIGFSSLMGRRLELASAMHLGMPRRALCGQMLLEAAAWVAVAMLVSGSLVVWQASGAVGQYWPIAILGLRCVIAGGVGSFIGIVIGCATIRERQLFSLFKTH